MDDFQNQKYIYIATKINNTVHDTKVNIYSKNLIPLCIYFAVRHCILATWLNDRDQFLSPNECWKEDIEFQNDCFVITLFHSQNQVSSKIGTNNWLPFTEKEVNSREKFDSNFMTNFIKGKIKHENEGKLNLYTETELTPMIFSDGAKAVFDAGRELWIYYHSKPGINVNASLYDIREHFQGRNPVGKMNNKSEDENYMELITALRYKLKLLAKKIEPKVYEYGFLKS